MEFDFSSDRPKRGPLARFASRMGDRTGKSTSTQSSEPTASQARTNSLSESSMVISAQKS